MTVKLLTKHHLKLLSLKLRLHRLARVHSPESTLVKIPNVAVHLVIQFRILFLVNGNEPTKSDRVESFC